MSTIEASIGGAIIGAIATHFALTYIRKEKKQDDEPVLRKGDTVQIRVVPAKSQNMAILTPRNSQQESIDKRVEEADRRGVDLPLEEIIGEEV